MAWACEGVPSSKTTVVKAWSASAVRGTCGLAAVNRWGPVPIAAVPYHGNFIAAAVWLAQSMAHVAFGEQIVENKAGFPLAHGATHPQ